MKIKILICLLVSIFTFESAIASHGMGGEITWRCLANGQFIFKLKFYRDCNGISGPQGTQLINVCGHPSLNTIPVSLTSQTDISSPGCSDCVTGGQGTVEEYVYESSPITIAGQPPPIGWIFDWGECCRSGSISNLQTPVIGFLIRSVMYPYNRLNTNLAYDSSPQFLNNATSIFCAGIPIQYSAAAHDPDGDSLVYSWGNALDDNPCDTNHLIYSPGYSNTSPFPGIIQHPLNIPATLNSQTGLISLTSFTSGYFVTVVKVQSYKCGVLVAEINREINIVILGNCPLIQGIYPNNPPIIIAPFQDTSGQLTVYSDTMFVGDSISFTITTSDFDLDSIGNPQTVLLDGHSVVFPDSTYIPGSICASPPCANLSSNIPIGPFTGGTNLTVNWVSDCNHLIGSTTCVITNRQVDMEFDVLDNYCDAPGINAKIVSIIVKDYAVVEKPHLDSLNTLGNGDSELFWSTVADPDNTFKCYYIYYSNFSNGPWILLDSVTVINKNTYIHVGAMGGNIAIFYRLATKSSNICHDNYISELSNKLWNMFSTATDISTIPPVKLYPNPVSDQIIIESELFLQQDVRLEITNLLGQSIYESVVHTKEWAIDVKNYLSGMYIITFKNENIDLASKKFIKQ